MKHAILTALTGLTLVGAASGAMAQNLLEGNLTGSGGVSSVISNPTTPADIGTYRHGHVHGDVGANAAGGYASGAENDRAAHGNIDADANAAADVETSAGQEEVHDEFGVRLNTGTSVGANANFN